MRIFSFHFLSFFLSLFLSLSFFVSLSPFLACTHTHFLFQSAYACELFLKRTNSHALIFSFYPYTLNIFPPSFSKYGTHTLSLFLSCFLNNTLFLSNFLSHTHAHTHSQSISLTLSLSKQQFVCCGPNLFF